MPRGVASANTDRTMRSAILQLFCIHATNPSILAAAGVSVFLQSCVTSTGVAMCSQSCITNPSGNYKGEARMINNRRLHCLQQALAPPELISSAHFDWE